MLIPEALPFFNRNLRHETPSAIIAFALEISEKPWVTTSFGPYSAALLWAVTQQRGDIPVVWCDTGFNTPATYAHSQALQERLKLNLDIFAPRYTTAFIEQSLGVPGVDNAHHAQFSEWVKLEPFRRALDTHRPDVWFTNLRQHQTSYRETLDILSLTPQGILKVCPFYYFSDAEMKSYCNLHQLPMEFDYFDPVKALGHRECGIHLSR